MIKNKFLMILFCGGLLFSLGVSAHDFHEDYLQKIENHSNDLEQNYSTPDFREGYLLKIENHSNDLEQNYSTPDFHKGDIFQNPTNFQSLFTPPPAGFDCPKCGGALDPVTGACGDCDYIYDNNAGLGTLIPISDPIPVLLLLALAYGLILLWKRGRRRENGVVR